MIRKSISTAAEMPSIGSASIHVHGQGEIADRFALAIGRHYDRVLDCTAIRPGMALGETIADVLAVAGLEGRGLSYFGPRPNDVYPGGIPTPPAFEPGKRIDFYVD